MSTPKVYLCGPIQGESYAAATGWREEVENLLAYGDIDTLSPLRQKYFLVGTKEIEGAYPDQALATDAAVVGQCTWDIERCDVVLANFTGSTRVSIGSAFEFGFAYSLRKPIVTVLPAGNVHDHPFIRRASTAIVDDLECAIEAVQDLLS